MLFSKINNGKTQEQIINELRENSKAKSRQIIPFIGSGASQILGIPSWPTLVRNYAERVGFTSDLLDLFNGYNRSWPEVTDDIFKYSSDVSGPDEALKIYREYMSGIKPTSAHFQSLHITLLQRCKRIITTNYDRAFEEAQSRILKDRVLKPLWYTATLLSSEFQDGAIAHMHGHVNGGDFVFRQAEYNYAYGEGRIISNFITPIVKGNYLLFIGFSFDDVVFRNMFEELISDWKRDIALRTLTHGKISIEQPKMYVFLSQKDLKTTFTITELTELATSKELIDKYFELNEEGDYEIIGNSDIEREVFFKDPFKTNYIDIKFNRERLDYLMNLNFDVIVFADGIYTQIDDRVTEIYQLDASASIDLPDNSRI